MDRLLETKGRVDGCEASGEKIFLMIIHPCPFEVNIYRPPKRTNGSLYNGRGNKNVTERMS